MKIAIMSDSHDRWENLEKAIQKANDADCKYLLFAGDLMSPPGLPTIERFKGKVVVVWGNNDGEKVGLTRKFDALKKIELAGDIYEGEIDGIRIFMNHYPTYSELAARSGDYDLAIHGHTHRYKVEKIGKTLLINPGEIQGFVTSKPSFVVFDTTSMTIEEVDI